jgi:hypothetical protein
MNRAFGVIGGGFGAGEFDGVDAAEVLDLVAFGFQPDTFLMPGIFPAMSLMPLMAFSRS